MESAAIEADVSSALEETKKVMLESSRRGFGAIPGDVLVAHLLEMTEGSDFVVCEAALEALRRRWDFARRDGLRIAAQPEKGNVFGVYATARPGKARAKAQEPRPYTSVLESLTPLRGSCDCADFVRSSLGLCKHLLCVLDHVFSNRRLLKQAQGTVVRWEGPRLEWDPRLPLAGELDRMTGLRLTGMGERSKPQRRRSSEDLIELVRAFPDAAPDPSLLRDVKRRHVLLMSLERAVTPGRRTRPALDASPSARAIVRDELARTARMVSNEGAARSVLSELRSLERRLYPYQREGVERFVRAGRLLLADDMGLGKTTQAIAACHALFRAGKVRRGLVIVPASLKPQWLREWQETTAVEAALVDGRPEERARQYRGLKAGFLIIGYEQLLRDFEHVQRLAPEMVVLDEAQRIKNYATKSSMYVKALTPEFRLVLTGTPMENRLEELASLLDWVDDIALAPKWRLVPWYTSWQGDGSSSGKAGARHLDTLRLRMNGCVVRRVRHDVLRQLPSRTDTRVPVAMTPQQTNEHDALIPPIATLAAIARRRPLLQKEFLKLMQLLTQQRMISNGLGQVNFEHLWPTYRRARPDAALLEGLFAPKLAELRRLIADLVLEQERKVVVFSQWRRMLRLAEWSVRDMLADSGLRAVFFTGAEKPTQRTQSIVDFHDDPRVRIMFLSDAGGVGLNLQRAASACINLELPWNPAVLEQRIGRIYRLGQKRPIDVFHLVSETGIESRIAELVGTKQALFSGLFDGTSDEVRFDGAASFLTRVERLLDPGPLPEVLQAPTTDDTDDVGVDDFEDSSSELASSPETLLTTDGAEEGPGSTAEPAVAIDSIASLFQSLRIERTAAGGVRFEAPPDAAASLVTLFEGMAKLLSTSGAGPRE